MIKIGKYNTLQVSRFTIHGAYLCDDEGNEVLLPSRYVDTDTEEGRKIQVFVYIDSEGRPVATTEHPYATVGEFAFLQVVDVNKIGAFLDWGLDKHLLVPYAEQKLRMHPGGIYLVYIYIDNVTGRVAATEKVNKYLGNVLPDYADGQKTDALVCSHDERGYRCIVDNLHKGMIYNNDVYKALEIGQTIKAYVRRVREDGKIDLTLKAPGTLGRIVKISSLILHKLEKGLLDVDENSSAEDIAKSMQCSKKDFKKAVSALYRQHKILLLDGHISKVEKE